MKKLVINGTAMVNCSTYFQSAGNWCFVLNNRIEIRVPMDEIKRVTSSEDLDVLTYRKNFVKEY